jgi:hypothetical protein
MKCNGLGNPENFMRIFFNTSLPQLLCGVLRSKGVNWRCVGAANNRHECLAKNLAATFVDLNGWRGLGFQ